jgi:large subunit ribosomal protein L31
MKEKIHPTWYPQAKMVCSACGTEWIVGSTVPERRVDVCSNCHPFYTGEQRIVDTEGQVDRFYKRLQQRDVMAQSRPQGADEAPTNIPIGELELPKRYLQILSDAGFAEVGRLATALVERGDDALLTIPGIGRKVLSDVKRKLRTMGFELPYQLGEQE